MPAYLFGFLFLFFAAGMFLIAGSELESGESPSYAFLCGCVNLLISFLLFTR